MENFTCENCERKFSKRNRNKALYEKCSIEYCNECANEFIEENQMESYLGENTYEKQNY
jgi:hypothetical protein